MSKLEDLTPDAGVRGIRPADLLLEQNRDLPLLVMLRPFKVLHISLRPLPLPRSLFGKLAYAEHLGPERAACGVQQVSQSRIVRSLSRCPAGPPYAAEVGEVLLDCCGQLSCAHPFAQGLITSIPLPSKASMSLVATDAPRLRAIAAIWQSA